MVTFFCILYALFALFAVGYFVERRTRAYYERMYLTASRAYKELSEGSADREEQWRIELRDNRNDAVRLAGVVRQYLADMDATAALVSDPEPPKLTVERDALFQHEQLHRQPTS